MAIQRRWTPWVWGCGRLLRRRLSGICVMIIIAVYVTNVRVSMDTSSSRVSASGGRGPMDNKMQDGVIVRVSSDDDITLLRLVGFFFLKSNPFSRSTRLTFPFPSFPSHPHRPRFITHKKIKMANDSVHPTVAPGHFLFTSESVGEGHPGTCRSFNFTRRWPSTMPQTKFATRCQMPL